MEYVIWGIPPGQSDEAPLYTLATTMGEALKVSRVLEAKHGCTRTRIQQLDMTKNDVLDQFRRAVRS